MLLAACFLQEKVMKMFEALKKAMISDATDTKIGAT